MESSQSTGQQTVPNCQTLHQTLNDFRLNNTLCDVTIMDETSNSTSAHSCILAAASPVLKSTIMLKDTNKMLIGQGVTLMIAGISVEVWKLLLEYLYLNTLVIPAIPGLLEEIMVAANMLGMKDLLKLINSHISDSRISLGPTKNVQSLKITLAPTRPVVQECKVVQVTPDEIDREAREAASMMRFLDANQLHQVARKQQGHPTTIAFQAGETPEIHATAMDVDVGVDESYTVSSQPSNPLRCRFCRMEFDKRANLVEHVSDWCSNLNKPFIPTDVKPPDSETMLDTKSKIAAFENEGEGKIYRCLNPECGQFFKTSTSLRKHSSTCILGSDTYRPHDMLLDLDDGTIIFRDYMEVANLEDGAIREPLAYLDSRYTKDHKGKVFNCAHCNFSAKRERMAVHLAVHHGKRKPFSCKVCGLRYGYYESLRDHYVGVHTNRQFNCTECGKVFQRLIMLRRHHLHEHVREGKALYPCKGCGKKFKNLAHARRHELYHNPTDSRRKYRCDECQKLFCTRQDLDRHIESVHSDVRPYKCSKCPYSTPRKFYLTQHEKKHGIVSGRYVCLTCDKCFVNETYFRNHMREKGHEGTDVMNDDASLEVLELSATEAQSFVSSQDGSVIYRYTTA